MGNRAYVAIGITFIVTPIFYVWLIYYLSCNFLLPLAACGGVGDRLGDIHRHRRHIYPAFFIAAITLQDVCRLLRAGVFHLRHDHIVREHLPIFWISGRQRGRYEYP